ncbi:MAG: hypothetical protein Q4D54_04970 [Eubacteriales bacterium]|nr:hypothetical protein [Lachnospiraceae bacterium]MDO5127084.1 hypothetical protein [Eubacteriales bacterium]
MKMEMTEKDKKLLVMLSIFVIVVCIGYWGIYPVLKDMKKISNEIVAQKDDQELNEMKIGMLPMLEAEHTKMEEDISKAREKYFPRMTNDEIDKYFTAMALNYSLQAYDLTIDSPNDEASLEPYQYSYKALEEVINEETSGAFIDMEDTESEGEESTGSGLSGSLFLEESTGNTGIYSATITLRLGGNEADLKQLINDLSDNSQIRICNFRWSDDRNVEIDASNEEYTIVTSKVLNLSLEIYMYEE